MSDDFTVNSAAAPPERTGVSNPPKAKILNSEPVVQDDEQMLNEANVKASWNDSPIQPAPQLEAAKQGPRSQPQPQKGQQEPKNELEAIGIARPPKKQPWNELNAVNGVPSDDVVKHPAVQKAGLFHTIAQTLAGGPRYKESIDVNTGQMKREQVPMSRGDIGMAIAMEAISGALAGLTQRGPGAEGRAAAAGFQQVQDQMQQAQQQQDQQAKDDYARHYQVLETNMKMHQNAVTLGRMDLDTHKEHVALYKDIADDVLNHPEWVQERVSEHDLSKYNVTADNAIPVGVVPVIDPKTKEQAVDQYGSERWEEQYLVLKPDAQITLPSDVIKTLQEMKRPGFVNGEGKSFELPNNKPLAARMVLNLTADAVAYRLGKDNLAAFHHIVNNSSGGTGAPTKEPQMTRPDFQDIADKAAKDNNVPRALVRQIIIQESHEDPKALNKKSGTMGLMQLTPDTAKDMGVVHAFDATENIRGGTKKLAMLLNDPKYKGNVKFALAAYNGAAHPTDPSTYKKETVDYLANISKAVGLDEQGSAASAVTTKSPDLAAAVAKDPTLVKALAEFNRLLNATGGNYGKAIGEIKDPTAAGKLTELFGGTEAIQQYDTQRALLADKTKREQDAQIAIDTKRIEGADKNKLDQEAASTMSEVIRGPKDFRFTPELAKLGPDDLADKLEAQGVTVPQNFPSLYAVAFYQDSLKDYAARTWKKGAPLEMSMQEAASYIHKFINPGYSEKHYAALELADKRFNDPSSDIGKQFRSADALFGHIGDALEASKELHNTHYGEAINKPINDFRKQYKGDVNLARLMAAIEPVKMEFMTFLNNSHALTEHDKKAGDDIMNWNMPVSVLDGQFKQFAKTAAIRLRATNNAFKRETGENMPGLVSESVLDQVRAMPELGKILGDLNTGGSAVDATVGRRSTGRTVREALGESPIPDDAREPLAEERAVWHQGKFAGYTIDGKHFSYQYSSGQPEQSGNQPTNTGTTSQANPGQGWT